MSNNNEDQGQQKPKTIGHYLFGKTLGEGTFGKVKLATHILTGEKVAIKILDKSKIQDASDVERVSREIHILKSVRHPHVIQLYEIIETPKQLFLIMEFASCGELFDYIVQNTRIKDLEAARFFNQIISGVEYIHKLNIVHRDLKPENLLLESKSKIKIVDFGLSNIYRKDETLKTACGSPCYAAPEMIAGKKYNGLQVDIWSCGVILFAMVCGYLPFEDPNTSALYKKILAGDYKIPKFLSPEVRDLIKNILNTDPTKRYTIEDIRKHPWFNMYKQTKCLPGLIVGYNRIPIDTYLMSSLQAYNFNLEYAQKCIESNRHNNVTTTYYLLLKRHLLNGGKSPADISSDTFEPQVLEQLNQTKQYIVIKNEEQQRANKSVEAVKTKISSTGGSSSQKQQDLIMKQQTQTEEGRLSSNTQYISLSTNPANPLPNISYQKIELAKILQPEQEKVSQQMKNRRAQNSIQTQNNSILSSPKNTLNVKGEKYHEYHSAENTQRKPVLNNNLNNLLNKPIDPYKTGTIHLMNPTIQQINNYNVVNEFNNGPQTTKNNTIYRQNLQLTSESNQYRQQQQFQIKNKFKTSLMTAGQRQRGFSQNENPNRQKQKNIFPSDQRGKSTEPIDDRDSSVNRMISVIDNQNNTSFQQSGNSSRIEARTFYMSSNRQSPVMDTRNENRKYIIPYHLKLKYENPQIMNMLTTTTKH